METKFNLTDISIMDFGVHKGSRLIDVPAAYLIWLNDQEWFIYGQKYHYLRLYIKENLDVLKQQAPKRV